MPSTVPTPVAAVLGIVPSIFDGVRRLPGKAISLPIYAISSALTTFERSRREYDALAERGERLIARLRGTSFDEVEDRVEDALQGTPLAVPYDRLEDALEDATENVTELVRSAPARARKAAGTAAATTGSALDRAADTVEDLAEDVADTARTAADSVGSAADTAADAVSSTADTAADAVGAAADTAADVASATADTAADAVGAAADTAADTASTTADTAADAVGAAADTGASEVPDAEAPKGVPTPKATEPDSTRIDTAASADVVETVERVSETIGGEVLPHDQLPLPDYDHLTLGSLRGRMRSLDVPQLVQVRDYEKAHANRLPIVTMLDNRIAKLATDPTARLSGSTPTDPVPAKPRSGKRGSKVDPSTAGPKINPPSQGDPTNPAQPR